MSFESLTNFLKPTECSSTSLIADQSHKPGLILRKILEVFCQDGLYFVKVAACRVCKADGPERWVYDYRPLTYEACEFEQMVSRDQHESLSQEFEEKMGELKSREKECSRKAPSCLMRVFLFICCEATPKY